MGQVLFTNNAEATLAGSITAAQTSISVNAGQGAKFPTIGGGSGDWFPVTLRSASALEIVRCTARTGDVLTVTRAQEGTVGSTFAAGDLCQLRLTAAAIADWITRISTIETAMLSQAQTGDTKYRPGNATVSGWVRANGLTIGNAASAATERANADCANLYSFLWATFADAQCPVSGGRGGSAAADFAANKRLTLPDAAGRAFISIDNAGAGVKGRITVATAPAGGATPGATGGAETRTLVSGNLPAHKHALFGGVADGAGTATASGDHSHGGFTNNNVVDGAHSHAGAATSTDGAHTHTGASTDAQGSHNHGSVTGAGGTHQHTVTDAAGRVFEKYDGSVSTGGRPIVQATTGGGGTGQVLFASAAGSDHNHGIGIDGSHAHNVTVPSTSSGHAHNVTVPSTSSDHKHVIAASGTHTHSVTLSGNTDNTGSGTAFDNMIPFVALGTLYLKL